MNSLCFEPYFEEYVAAPADPPPVFQVLYPSLENKHDLSFRPFQEIFSELPPASSLRLWIGPAVYRQCPRCGGCSPKTIEVTSPDGTQVLVLGRERCLSPGCDYAKDDNEVRCFDLTLESPPEETESLKPPLSITHPMAPQKPSH